MEMTFCFKLTEVSSKLPCRGHVGNLTLNASPRNRSPFIYSENVYSFYDGALWMDLHNVAYTTLPHVIHDDDVSYLFFRHPIIDLEVEVYGVAVTDLTECSS